MRRNTVILSIATLIAAACSTVTADKLAKLQPGVSTRADAEAALGPPNSVTDRGGDQVLLQWIDAKPMGAGHVAILFRKAPPQQMVRVQHQHFTQ